MLYWCIDANLAKSIKLHFLSTGLFRDNVLEKDPCFDLLFLVLRRLVRFVRLATVIHFSSLTFAFSIFCFVTFAFSTLCLVTFGIRSRCRFVSGTLLFSNRRNGMLLQAIIYAHGRHF